MSLVSMLDLKDKIIIFLIALLGLSLCAFLIYNQLEHKKDLAALQTQLNQTQQLANNITAQVATLASKADLQAYAQTNVQNFQEIQNSIKQMNATLTAVSSVTAVSSGQTASNVPSSSSTSQGTEPTPTTTCNGQTVPCSNPDKYNYLSNPQTLDLNEQFPAQAQGSTATSVPIGNVTFSASQQEPWSLNILPRQYNLTTTLATKDDGSDQQVAYNQLTIAASGKTYTVPISQNKFVQAEKSASFSFWNPRLYLGVDGSLNLTKLSSASVNGDFVPNLSLGIMSYGISKNTPDWNILDVGVGYGTASHDTQISVSPFSYDVAKAAKPLLRNGYLGPTIMLDPVNGSWSVGAGLKVGL
jgi:hypothetical protein